MTATDLRFVGVELYFDDASDASRFYCEILGLKIAEQVISHHTKFDFPAGFVCLERKGCESYPSRDKAVLFFETEQLDEMINAIGRERFLQIEESWAMLHDPEGHNVVLLKAAKR